MAESAVAAPVAAPAAAVPSSPAPASTPAPAAPSNPVAPAAPAAAPITSTPEAPAAAPAAGETPAPAAPAAVEKPGKPDRATYGDNIEQFLKDTYAWEDANPDGTELVTGDEVTVDPEAADKPAEEVKIDEETGEPKAEEKTPEAAAPTPEALSKLIEDHPEFKAALEAAPPAVKGALYAMARKNAIAVPILALVPNVEAAKFAVDTSNEFVSLKTAFQLSDSPEKMQDAAGMFLEQFAILDDKGQPVMDAKGQPTYGEDLPLFVSEIKKRDNSARIDTLKERIAANRYVSTEGAENDAQLLAAYEFITAAEEAGFDELDKPNTDNFTPEQKAYFDREQAKIDAEKERLGIKDKELTTKQKSETRTKNDTKFKETFGASTGKYLANYLKQKAEAGVAIPTYLMTMKDRDGVPVIAKTAFDRLNAKIKNDTPQRRAHSATLEMNAINEQGLAARVTWGQERVDEFLPDIVDDILREAGVSLAADAKNQIAERDKRLGDARVEPAGGGPVTPSRMSDEQVMKLATENITKKFGDNIDPGKRIEEIIKERNRLQAGG